MMLPTHVRSLALRVLEPRQVHSPTKEGRLQQGYLSSRGVVFRAHPARIHKGEAASCPLKSLEDLTELLNSKAAKKYDPDCIAILLLLEQSVYREIAHFAG